MLWRQQISELSGLLSQRFLPQQLGKTPKTRNLSKSADGNRGAEVSGRNRETVAGGANGDNNT